MFYSTEVLTSRKYGVATVWLVATLGSKSTLKKVSRKAILDVDVAKACDTIENPDAPMALRLQSNLLYGVARVYSQQCGYVLNDVETARNQMRAMFRVMQKAELQTEGGNKGRTEQIVLQDDPNFLPDLHLMPVDLENLNLDIDLNETQMSLTPGGSQSRLSSASQQSIGGLNLSASQSSFAGGAVGGFDLFGVRGDSGPGTVARAPAQLLDDDDLGLDVGDVPARQPRAPSGKVDCAGGGSVDGKFDDAPDQLMLDLNDDGFTFNNIINFDGDFAGGLSAPNDNETRTEDAEFDTAMAPARKKCGRRARPLDEKTTVNNSTIGGWGKNYLEKMREESRKSQTARMNAIAKKNAAHWVLQAGIFLGQGMRGPLDMFSGAALIEAFTGINPLKSKKRQFEDGEQISRISKRSRIGGPSSDGIGRGGLQEDEDITINHNEDDVAMHNHDEIEQGREAPTPLEDRQHSSIFPWNQSGSRGMGSRGGHPNSASLGAGGAFKIPNSRRGSRLTSASPLVGRGVDIGVGRTDELDTFPLDLSGEDEFELYGAAAQVDTQKAAESQWQRAALTGESANFLEFVQSAVTEGAGGEETAFETLLPPESNSKIVAAQGLLHVLALASKGALVVQQEDHFEPIRLKVTTEAGVV